MSKQKVIRLSGFFNSKGEVHMVKHEEFFAEDLPEGEWIKTVAHHDGTVSIEGTGVYTYEFK